MLGYRDSGHARHAGQRAPRLLPPGRSRRGRRAARRGRAAREAASHPHLRGRPARSTRTPTTCGSTTSRSSPSSERAILTGIPSSGDPFQPSKLYYSSWSRRRMLAVHEALLARDGNVTVRREVVRTPRHGPPDHDPRRGRRLPVGPLAGAARACHAGRPEREVLVRAGRRRARRRLSVGGLDPRPFAGRADPRRRLRA